MSLQRINTVVAGELRYNFRRPMILIFILVIFIQAFGLSQGSVKIQSGESGVGGMQSWITSEFANAMFQGVLVTLVFTFFIAVASGMSVLRDDEARISDLLHATPMRPWEYIWSKFVASFLTFIILTGLYILFAIFFNHVVPNTDTEILRGPFDLMNYIRPAILLSIPNILFVTGITFALGIFSRKPVMIFSFPVVLFLAELFFFWDFDPAWLSLRANRLLMVLDPSGFRWLDQTYLNEDRGVAFYNHASMELDIWFVLNRVLILLVGLLCVWLASRRFAARLTAAEGARRRRGQPIPVPAVITQSDTDGISVTSRHLGKKTGVTSWWRLVWNVSCSELQQLRFNAGLYLFLPLILLEIIGTNLVSKGNFDTDMLITSGIYAVRTLSSLTLMLVLLLTFYMVESLHREKITRMAPLVLSSGIPTSALILGKIAANFLLALGIIVVVSLAGAAALIIMGTVPYDITPFFLVYGLILVPTVIAWLAFVTFLYTVLRSRYATYGVALATMAYTGYRQVTGKMNWVGNWNVWKAMVWTDRGPLHIDRSALLLNRLLYVSIAVLLIAIAISLFPRRRLDSTTWINLFTWRHARKAAMRFLPFVIVPLVTGIVLFHQVRHGFQGSLAEKAEKDYWRRNLATWRDVSPPALKHVDARVRLEPDRRYLQSSGEYTFANETDAVLDRFPITGGPHWENVSWTLNGVAFEPDNRSHLFVFDLPEPVAPGGTFRVGFSFDGFYPRGVTKNGGGAPEFVLPSGVVLTSFTPSFVPLPGYFEEVGIDKKNHYDARDYPDDFYLGDTAPMVGSASPFTTSITVILPDRFRANSVGILTDESRGAGWASYTWESDYPVRFFNIVASEWVVERRGSTALYYFQEHPYNIDEIADGLEAAMTWYSQWYAPYPWQELKISEFPGMAYYAQGFPTNISFSEHLGFLTRDDPTTHTAFWVTAHESAHQWWANLLTPGEGPGGNILSEGMAHFSTIRLIRQIKGESSRMAFCRMIETDYCHDRRADAEKSLAHTDGSRAGDRVVMYDKGGWVFWMLLQHMGETRFSLGIHSFIDQYRNGPDYPVIQDFTTHMRPFSPDPERFDAFCDQWFYSVALPEFTILTAESSPAGDSWRVRAGIKNTGTGSVTVTAAAVSGDRFDDDGHAVPEYKDCRTELQLDSGETREIELICDFKPEKLVIDPDLMMLMQRRKHAEKSL